MTNEALFGWGSGPALGLEGNVLEPTAVGSASAMAQKKVVDISCSASISLARTDDGCLFHWGEFWDPDVEDFECIKNPTEIPGLRAVGMSCGDAHYLAVRLLPNACVWPHAAFLFLSNASTLPVTRVRIAVSLARARALS